MAEAALAILTLNVCSPTVARAEQQLEWLKGRGEQLFVLTEVSGGGGSALLGERMRAAGWSVRGTAPRESERGVVICSKVALGEDPPPAVSYLPERAATVRAGRVEVIGVYAPSRDDSPEKVARKRRFLAELLTAMGQGRGRETVLIGDLNIVERSGRGSDRLFADWEYELYEALPKLGWLDAYRAIHPNRSELSWADGEGRGFRFDHTFLTSDLGPQITRCEYLHETRNSNLSDHSAMVVELAIAAPAELEVDASLAAGPASLF